MNDEQSGVGIPVKSILGRRVSYFATIRSRREAASETTLGKFFHDVKTGRWQGRIEAFRQAQSSGSASLERIFPKNKLPAVKPSGLFSALDAASLVKHSGCLCVDIDAKDNPKIRNDASRSEVCRRLREDPHVFAHHVSTGGQGLAVYVAVAARTAAQHKECFAVAAAHFRTVFDVTIDSLCSDVSRNRFVSFDPDTWVRHDGVCTMFDGATASLSSESGVSRNWETCPVYSKNEFSPSPLHVSSEEKETGLEDHGPGEAQPSAASLRFSAKLYGQWVAHRPAVQGMRNKTICELVPILTNIVGRGMVLDFLLRFYDQAAGAFTDSREQHEAESRSMIEASLRSYATNAKIGLTAKERSFYQSLDERRQDVFRITRSLARIAGNDGVFVMTDGHLGQRLGCDKNSAGRSLDYLVRDGVLKVVTKGEPRRLGCRRVATRYRWAL